MAKKVGKITIPKGAIALEHEMKVATILSWSGHDVEFIPLRTVQTPDIKYKKLKWEIKSPKGKSSRTIENNMRNALKQSNNIIIDLSRIKQPENKCIGVIKRRAQKLGKKQKVMIITKSGEIIELF